MHQRKFDIVLTALAPVIWGSTYIVTTEYLPPDRPLIAATLRTLPAGMLLAAFARQLPAKGQWGRLLLLSALNIGFFQALLFVAAYRLPGGVAAVVGAIQPLMVIALAWALDGRRSSAVAIAAATAGIGGMAALLLSPGAVWDAVGIAAALVGAASMAAGMYLAQRWKSDMPVMAFTGWQLLLGGAMLAPAALAFDPPLPALTGTQVLAYAYLSLVGAMAAYALWFRGVARLSPVAVSSLGLLSPLTAVVLGWAVLGQRLDTISLLGMTIVLTSILTVQWAAQSKPPELQPVKQSPA